MDRVAVGKNAFGYNALRLHGVRLHGDMIAMGIIDLTEVTQLGPQNAVSLASLILNADCSIVDAPKHGAPGQENLPRGD